MSGQFEAVLWDVDGTLLDFLYAQRIAITECLKQVGVTATDEMIGRYSEINDSYWKKLELGMVTKEELHVRRFADFLEEYQIHDADVGLFKAQYLDVLANIYHHVEGALELCTALKGKVKQYVITNGVPEVQEKKLRLSGLYDLMDGIFVSEQIGVPKPKAGFFDYCMDVIKDIDKSKMLIVGDSLTSDIKGGVMYHIPTCWYREDDYLQQNPQMQEVYEQFKPDYEISHLSELYHILNISYK